MRRAHVPGLLSLSLIAVLGGPLAAAPRTTQVLSINDTYRVEGAYGGTVGGFARVRTLRRELEKTHPELLVLHAGDLFFPSLLSRTFQGRQMVDGLNRLDGDPEAFDPRLFITFGNHEFDKPKLEDAGIVQSRIAESQFTWLAGNVQAKPDGSGRPYFAGANLLRSKLVTSGGIKIGLFGLTLATKVPAYATITDPEAAARELTAELRREGAEVVIGLTHQELAADRQLLADLGDAGPDLILGGHEHTIQRENVGGRWICKADADAASACLVTLTIDDAGRLSISPPAYEALAGGDPAPDPALQLAADGWVSRHAEIFCAARRQAADCLDRVVGFTRTALGAEETKIRGEETSLGNYLTDVMIGAFADRGAQVAFINAGSLRLNRDIAAHVPLTLRDVEELFEYPAPLKLLRLSGRTLAEVVSHGADGWPGQGRWLQVAGLAFRRDEASGTISDLTLLTPSGPRPLHPDEQVLAVATDYLVNPEGDQDGYHMLNPAQVVATGGDLKGYALAAFAGAGKEGIAPEVEGRICLVAAKPCLAQQGAAGPAQDAPAKGGR